MLYFRECLFGLPPFSLDILLKTMILVGQLLFAQAIHPHSINWYFVVMNLKFRFNCLIDFHLLLTFRKLGCNLFHWDCGKRISLRTRACILSLFPIINALTLDLYRHTNFESFHVIPSLFTSYRWFYGLKFFFSCCLCFSFPVCS